MNQSQQSLYLQSDTPRIRNGLEVGSTRIQPWLQHDLSQWSEIDDPVFFMVFGLVGGWPVCPNALRAIEVDCSQLADFARSHAGQALNVHHGHHNRIHENSDSLDIRLSHRPEAVCFTGLASTHFQTGNRLQRCQGFRLDESFRDSPAEHSVNTTDLLVDRRTGQVSLDEVLAKSLQCCGAERVDLYIRIELA